MNIKNIEAVAKALGTEMMPEDHPEYTSGQSTQFLSRSLPQTAPKKVVDVSNEADAEGAGNET